ncbi:class I SAM-dependent methyltransferase [Thermodesulfobacteriota bacterium]
MTAQDYVHGYSSRENIRLSDQANTLSWFLHHDTHYLTGTRVLEVGCGVGAQTTILAKNSPEAQITSIDISQESIKKARALTEKVPNVTFQAADIFNLPFKKNSFDHIFVCFVLEHLANPEEAMECLKSHLKQSGTITVIEGDHGSTYFYPDSRAAWRTIQCLIDTQASLNGNSLIGRQLYPILSSAGFRNIMVSPRMIYVDSSKPELVEGFTKNTFVAMVEGVREQAITAGLIDSEDWQKGITDLYRTTNTDGTFCYTFFKGTAIK